MTLLALLLSLGTLSGLATAHPQTVLDPDDSDGVLDIVGARLGHETYTITETHGTTPDRHPTKVRLKLITYETWPDSVISSDSGSYVRFDINMDRDADVERCVIITYEPEEGEFTALAAKFCRDDGVVMHVRTFDGRPKRPDEHSIKVSLAKRFVAPGPDSVSWRAVTVQADCMNGPAPACYDETQWKRHRF